MKYRKMLVSMCGLTLTACGAKLPTDSSSYDPTANNSPPPTETSIKKDIKCSKATVISGKTYTLSFEVTTFYNGNESEACASRDYNNVLLSSTAANTPNETVTHTCTIGYDLDGAHPNGYWLFYTNIDDTGDFGVSYVGNGGSFISGNTVFYNMNTDCTGG